MAITLLKRKIFLFFKNGNVGNHKRTRYNSTPDFFDITGEPEISQKSIINAFTLLQYSLYENQRNKLHIATVSW